MGSDGKSGCMNCMSDHAVIYMQVHDSYLIRLCRDCLDICEDGEEVEYE